MLCLRILQLCLCCWPWIVEDETCLPGGEWCDEEPGIQSTILTRSSTSSRFQLISLRNILCFIFYCYFLRCFYLLELELDLCWRVRIPEEEAEEEWSTTRIQPVPAPSLSGCRGIQDTVWQPRWWRLQQEQWRGQTCRDSWGDDTWPCTPWEWLRANMGNRQHWGRGEPGVEGWRPVDSRVWWQRTPWSWVNICWLLLQLLKYREIPSPRHWSMCWMLCSSFSWKYFTFNPSLTSGHVYLLSTRFIVTTTTCRQWLLQPTLLLW